MQKGGKPTINGGPQGDLQENDIHDGRVRHPAAKIPARGISPMDEEAHGAASSMGEIPLAGIRVRGRAFSVSFASRVINGRASHLFDLYLIALIRTVCSIKPY